MAAMTWEMVAGLGAGSLSSAAPYDVRSELVDVLGLIARALGHVPSIALRGAPSSLWKFKRPHYRTFGLNFPIFISTMAVNVFHADAPGFGLLSSIMAIGTMSGALLATGRDRPSFGSLLLGAGVFGIGCTLAAFSPGYWWFAGALAVIGVAALTFTNATNSMMQLSTKPTMRGRVMAIRVGVGIGGTSIGAPIVGWVANHFGPRWSLGIGAASGFAAAVVALCVMGQRIPLAGQSELAESWRPRDAPSS